MVGRGREAVGKRHGQRGPAGNGEGIAHIQQSALVAGRAVQPDLVCGIVGEGQIVRRREGAHPSDRTTGNGQVTCLHAAGRIGDHEAPRIRHNYRAERTTVIVGSTIVETDRSTGGERGRIRERGDRAAARANDGHTTAPRQRSELGTTGGLLERNEGRGYASAGAPADIEVTAGCGTGVRVLDPHIAVVGDVGGIAKVESIGLRGMVAADRDYARGAVTKGQRAGITDQSAGVGTGIVALENRTAQQFQVGASRLRTVTFGNGNTEQTAVADGEDVGRGHRHASAVGLAVKRCQPGGIDRKVAANGIVAVPSHVEQVHLTAGLEGIVHGGNALAVALEAERPVNSGDPAVGLDLRERIGRPGVHLQSRTRIDREPTKVQGTRRGTVDLEAGPRPTGKSQVGSSPPRDGRGQGCSVLGRGGGVVVNRPRAVDREIVERPLHANPLVHRTVG